jgi:platelet-activating factor acetylhydrolase
MRTHSWPDRPADQQPCTDSVLRHFQLKLRVKEIFYTIDTMTRIANGEDVAVASVRRPNFDWSTWKDRVDTTKPIMAGHSLGGSAAVREIRESRTQQQI